MWAPTAPREGFRERVAPLCGVFPRNRGNESAMNEEDADEIRAALKKARRWSAWELQWSADAPPVLDCAAARQALAEELQGFFQDFAVAWARVGAGGDRVAFRVAIAERASAKTIQRKTATVYLLYFLRSDLVLASAMKVRAAALRPSRRPPARPPSRGPESSPWGRPIALHP
jgi:hypothetical protein